MRDDAGKPLLLVGDFFPGAEGPTILLILMSRAAGAWFQEALREMANGVSLRVLTADPRVFVAHVDCLEMINRSTGPRVALKRRDADDQVSFVWSATKEGWLYLADLTYPLCAGGNGHHYLTDDKEDDAVIELSFGEYDAQIIDGLLNAGQ